MKFRDLVFTSFFLLSHFIGYSQNIINGIDYIRKINNFNKLSEKKPRDDRIAFIKEPLFGEPLSGEAKNSLEGDVMNIYFQTNKFQLTGTDSSDLRKYISYISQTKKILSFNIEGFADCTGNDELNYSLSEKRTESIAKILKRTFPNSIIYVSSFGKSKSTQTTDSMILQKERVVKIFPNKNSIERALDISSKKAGIYLLDQSGSMNINGEWKFLQNYFYPDSSEIYSFSKLDDDLPESFYGKKHTYDIKEEVAMGLTSYSLALETLLSIISENKEITIVVNGKNNFKEDNYEKIIEKSKEKKIRLNHIGINLDEDAKKEFRRISENTMGQCYFLKKFN